MATSKWILACTVFLLPLRLCADDWLVNGDFSDAITHWYGEAKSPADFAPPDPFTKADPFTAAGMIIPLRQSTWVKEFQDFKGKADTGVLKISYILSPGLTFSSKPDDYKNMPDKIGWDAWRAFDSPPNAWIIFISDLTSREGTYYIIQPQLNSTEEQTISYPVRGLTPLTDKTIALAFPPGNGTIVLHKVELSDQ